MRARGNKSRAQRLLIRLRATYAIVVLGTRPGFDRPTAAATLARLFRTTADAVQVCFEQPTVMRRGLESQAALRLAELLTLAGMQCHIEAENSPAAAPSALARPQPLHAATTRMSSLFVGWHASITEARHRAARLLAHVTPRIRARAIALERRAQRFRSDLVPLIRRLHAWIDARHRAYLGGRATWTPAMQQVTFSCGAIVCVAILAVAAPGYSALHPTPAPSSQIIAAPVPPATPELLRTDTIDVVPVLPVLPVNPVQQTSTSLGPVAIVQTDARAGRAWQLQWNGVALRTMQGDTTPGFVPLARSQSHRAFVAELGTEVALVLDTGERSAMCPAAKALVVVLSRARPARVHEVQGKCAELEKVSLNGRRVLLHFYDERRPTHAYDRGRLIRLDRQS